MRDVTEVIKIVVARQIAHEPMFRKTVRKIHFEGTKISILATERGLKKINENHSIYSLKCLKGKPAHDFHGDQFLQLCIAEYNDLIAMNFSMGLKFLSTKNWIYFTYAQNQYFSITSHSFTILTQNTLWSHHNSPYSQKECTKTIAFRPLT